ncbi:MAG: metallophosphoesterase [Terriglobia bacterium]
MAQNKIERAQASDLEMRLARRRAIEAAVRDGKWKEAHGEPVLLRDRFAAPLLRKALKMSGLYRRGLRNALAPIIRRVRFGFNDLPKSFDGFRILHLSDLHIDGMEGLAEVIAERISGLEADLCVMTGDYRFKARGPCHDVYPRLRTVLSSIEARHGVVAILGNHDDSEIAVELEKLGVRMLINEGVSLSMGSDCLGMLGVDDLHRYGCDDLAAALASVPADAFKILLAHSPELWQQAAAADIRLYLCGHTHAGQMCLPGVGALVMNARCPRPYTDGRWRHGVMLGYTSAGAGCSLLPLRYNCPPEITVIELHSTLTSVSSATHTCNS